MRILFAASDRDLLSGYKSLLEAKGHETDAAFDGVQAVTRISEGYDAAVIDQSLSRLSSASVLKKLCDGGVPTVMLLFSRITGELYLSPVLPDTFLCYPFSPDELDAALTAATGLRDMPDFDLFGTAVSPSKRTFAGNVRITSEEALLLKRLSDGAVRDSDCDILIRAVCEKMRIAGTGITVKYITNEGYKVVKTVE